MDNMAKFKYSDESELEKAELIEVDQEEEITSVTEERKLSTENTFPEIETLMNRIERGDIILHPEYQRNYVWTVPQASKFIESLFINIPVAPIFTNENGDGTQEVIDGQQRLTTIYKFYKGELVLKGLRYFNGLNGKSFTTLSRSEQRTFLSKSLSFIRINKESSEDIKFDVFTRINQGGTPLTNQEMRRVMYRGKYIDFLDDLIDTRNRRYKEFNDIFESKQYLTKNLGNQEIALRLISISKMVNSKLEISTNYSGDLQSAFTSYLKENRDNKEEIDRVEEEFKNVLDKLSEIFPNPSERFASYIGDSKGFSRRINKAVAEFEYLLSRELYRSGDTREGAEIRKLVIEVLKENEQDCFGRRAPNRNMLELRLMKINEIVNGIQG